MTDETKGLLRDPKALADYLTEKALECRGEVDAISYEATKDTMADAATTIIAEHAADRPLAGEMTLRELGALLNDRQWHLSIWADGENFVLDLSSSIDRKRITGTEGRDLQDAVTNLLAKLGER